MRESHQYQPPKMLDFSLKNQDVQSSQQIDNFEGEQAEEMDTLQRISMLEKFKNTICYTEERSGKFKI